MPKKIAVVPPDLKSLAINLNYTDSSEIDEDELSYLYGVDED